MNNKLLKYFSNIQNKLDNTILKNFNLTEIQTFEKRILAFLIELSEFINKEKDFKYWSKKKVIKKNILLEEYADGIHFLISIGNTLKINFNNYLYKYPIKNNQITLTQLYLKCFEVYINFIKIKNEKRYFNVLNIFFALAKKMNFTEKELILSYKKKIKINYKRQINNY